MGDPPVYASWRFGPYDVGPQPSYVLAIAAAALALAAVALLVVRTRRGAADLQSWAVAIMLAVAGAFASSGWREATSSYSGADIGGPVVMLLDPMLVAGFLVGTVWIAAAGGRARKRTAWLLTGGAVLVAPAMWATMYALSVYDGAAGIITAQQYAGVHAGQSRSAVHALLGREVRDDFAFEDFPHTPPSLACDYYREATPGERWFQFCFRSGVLVSKDASVVQCRTGSLTLPSQQRGRRSAVRRRVTMSHGRVGIPVANDVLGRRRALRGVRAVGEPPPRLEAGPRERSAVPGRRRPQPTWQGWLGTCRSHALPGFSPNADKSTARRLLLAIHDLHTDL